MKNLAPTTASASDYYQTRRAIPTVDLIDGNRMPLTGIGMCCRPTTAAGPAATQSVIDYLNLGGRHIDTAVLYQNHEQIGAGIKQWLGNTTAQTGFAETDLRREIFLTTKVWSDKFGFQNTYDTVRWSLDELQVDYVDLVLLHVSGERAWQGAEKDPVCLTKAHGDQRPHWEHCRFASWKALELLKDEGYVRSIGVSNWDEPKIDALHAVSKHRVAVNQLELHPWYPQKSMREFAKREKIILTAYGSMGSNRMSKQIVEQEAFKKLAEQVEAEAEDETSSTSSKHFSGAGISSGQILLRWAVQEGIVVIPGTGNVEHMRQNLEIFRFRLSDDQMEFLNSQVGDEMHLYNHRPDLIL
eukprot:g8245.t1